MLRAVLFDYNGVLVDDEPLHFEALRRALADDGLEVAETDYWQRWVGLDDRSAIEGLLARAGSDGGGGQAMRLVARKASYYRELLKRRGHRLFAGARELVEGAVAAGMTAGVVSGALREEVESGLRAAGLDRLFKVVLTAEDVARGKPDPEIYRRGVRLLNEKPPLPERLLHPHETLAVEDSPPGLAAAAAAGLKTLGVAHTLAVERLAAADLVVDSLATLTWRDLSARLSA